MKQKTKIISKKGQKNLKLAIVVSRFNERICEGLLSGALRALKEAGISESCVQVVRVPGAFEIPLAAQHWARKKKVDGLICLGAVIRGDTPHFEYVSQAVTDGVLRVGLDTGVPCIFGVITVNTLDQALARSSDNEYNKGREAAAAVLEMIEILKNKN